MDYWRSGGNYFPGESVHNFMAFSARDAKGRMKANLGAIDTAQSGYFSETKTDGSSLGLINRDRGGVNIYGFCIGEDHIPPNACIYRPERNIRESIGCYFGDCEARIRQINAHAKRLCREFSGASSKGFTVMAISNIDYDSDTSDAQESLQKQIHEAIGVNPARHIYWYYSVLGLEVLAHFKVEDFTASPAPGLDLEGAGIGIE